MTVFDCPECDHVSHHWHEFTGFFSVLWHFYSEHPDTSFKAGNPLDDEKGPQFDDR